MQQVSRLQNFQVPNTNFLVMFSAMMTPFLALWLRFRPSWLQFRPSWQWVPVCRTVSTCRIREISILGLPDLHRIHNFVLPDWPFCSSGVVRETAPTATHSLGSDGNSKQLAVLTVYASFSSVFGIVLDVVSSFSCFITPFSCLLALFWGVIASFSNGSHRLGSFSHQFLAW